jgi:hypothetical protein
VTRSGALRLCHNSRVSRRSAQGVLWSSDETRAVGGRGIDREINPHPAASFFHSKMPNAEACNDPFDLRNRLHKPNDLRAVSFKFPQEKLLVHNLLLLNSEHYPGEKRGLHLRSWIFEIARELLPYTYFQLHPFPLNGRKNGK